MESMLYISFKQKVRLTNELSAINTLCHLYWKTVTESRDQNKLLLFIACDFSK